MTIILVRKDFLQEGYLPVPAHHFGHQKASERGKIAFRHVLHALFCVFFGRSASVLVLFALQNRKKIFRSAKQESKIYTRVYPQRKITFRIAGGSRPQPESSEAQKGQKIWPTTCLQVIGHMPSILCCNLNNPISAVRSSELVAPGWSDTDLQHPHPDPT